MTKSKTNPKVDALISKATKWQKEIEKLRKILLHCGLTEEVKWNQPCYTFEGANIVVVGGFKEHCALLLCKGALLKDRNKLLIKPGEETQGGRQIRFTGLQEIVKLEPVLKAYIHEAIAAEKAGLKVEYKKITERKVPEELEQKFKENPALKTAFQALTPGRQRLYLMHFSTPKQSKTREARIEKCTPQILEGEGLNEEYRSPKKK